jgi:hypothetical protein
MFERAGPGRAGANVRGRLAVIGFLRKSRAGAVAALLYLLIAAGVFIAHVYSVKTNPADSGESAIPFFLLTLPWTLAVPASWMYSAVWAWAAYSLAWLFVGINALILYCAAALGVFVLGSAVNVLGFSKKR